MICSEQRSELETVYMIGALNIKSLKLKNPVIIFVSEELQ